MARFYFHCSSSSIQQLQAFSTQNTNNFHRSETDFREMQKVISSFQSLISRCQCIQDCPCLLLRNGESSVSLSSSESCSVIQLLRKNKFYITTINTLILQLPVLMVPYKKIQETEPLKSYDPQFILNCSMPSFPDLR